MTFAPGTAHSRIPTSVFGPDERALVAEFVDERIRPIAAELDETERFPEEIYAEMGKIGLFGITVPHDDGGAGGTALDYLFVMESLSYGYASIADQCGLVEILGTLLNTYGTDDQKKEYLLPMLSAEKRCAYALTEPGSGSDLGSITTRAERTSTGWRLRGEKIYIHNAPVADFAVVLAVTDPERGKRGGISVFLVDVDTPGVSRAYHEHKMGQRASQVGGLVFDDAELAESALLGEEGQAFGYMMKVLAKGRLGISGLALGISRAALDAAVRQSLDRQQFGRAIADNQAISFSLASIATELQAATALSVSAARAIDSGDDDAEVLCSMAKLNASESCVRHADAALQVFGGNGFIRGYEVERLYRDARITKIYEGTSEMQRLIISRSLLRSAG
ncbi:MULTISPECIES: acyl-CoA dehydrogenase family protein [Gordonia]|uniref:Acyl-CoA dehydrogenase n=2 Tax=Gordonia terrae TaxID=2055 RepID=A0AAD0K9Y8_9ACTN|nr:MULTISPECIES: acyl-CoA dehydrogenase family protein [Gordonia]VTR07731.1 acyl-CoA dehydrogenase family protein [Clostridioides difficile]ANY24906.1 acyl-CoA dehydrogenase [Gordonia terrae]AWO85655.1 acyl-CoA dehydrogenase [Gordonia terrae]MCG7635156.1 acyl-CoA dehydrogenase family protein [Gordonia sp. McavH-238-E]VTS60803.1 Acyl-CoA dehydrogenase, short-chain specific [Gordonia terrae]